jgi:hypothetical protein
MIVRCVREKGIDGFINYVVSVFRKVAAGTVNSYTPVGQTKFHFVIKTDLLHQTEDAVIAVVSFFEYPEDEIYLGG